MGHILENTSLARRLLCTIPVGNAKILSETVKGEIVWNSVNKESTVDDFDVGAAKAEIVWNSVVHKDLYHYSPSI